MCSEGHRWEATAGNIKAGKWCRKCSGREPLSIEEMRQIGLARGGKCLSTEYVNNREYLDWESGLVDQVEQDGTARFKCFP